MAAGVLVGVPAPALAGPAVHAVHAVHSVPSVHSVHAESSPGGLDPSDLQSAAGMLPADSPDGRVALRAVAPGAVRPHALGPQLQPYSSSNLQGVDVSSYQHPGGAAINWAAAHTAGVAFAFVKATESTGYTNPYYAQDVSAARAAGLQVGAYHFARPYYSAVAQADLFAAVIRTAPATLPPVLDLEDNGGLTPTALVAWTHAFLSRVQSDTGQTPVIYTGPYFWNDDMGGSTGFTGYPLWVANYTNLSTPDAVSGWSAWSFWQYNDGAFPLGNGYPPPPVPGISGYVDRDRFAGSSLTLAAFATGLPDLWLQTIGVPITGTALGPMALATYSMEIRNRTQTYTYMAYRLLRSLGGLYTSLNADYRRVLGRPADPAGLVAGAADRSTSLTELRSIEFLVSSSEFYTDSGSTPAGFIQRAYQTLLGRPADPVGLSTFEAALSSGVSRFAIANALLMSGEGLAHQVNLAYELVLDRPADPLGSASSVGALARGTTYEQLCAALYGSGEYLAHHVS